MVKIFKIKQSSKDRRLAALAREFKAGRLTLAQYQEAGYGLILAHLKGAAC